MKLLRKYEILEHLGAGATADVYYARDTVLGREVAIKVLKPALVADAQAFARFVQEARAAASLFHPHIATVLDMSEADGRYFLAMRYISGRALDKLLAEQGSLPLQEVQHMARQIGEALDYAHRAGFLHRDVKPSNILRDQQNDYWLTDFGLTRAMMMTGLTSHTGAVLGTPSYISPEIWLGQPATPATDQYALACVVVEALTGKTLFTGETPPAIMTQHVLMGAEQLEALNLPPSLRPVLARALAKEPQERYASMDAFTQALANDGPATPEGDVIPEPPQPEQRPVSAQQSRNRSNSQVFLSITVIVLILIAVLAFIIAFSSTQTPPVGANSTRVAQANGTTNSRTAEAVATSVAAAPKTSDAGTEQADQATATAAVQRTSTARSVQSTITAQASVAQATATASAAQEIATASSAQATATASSAQAAAKAAIADWRLVVQDSFNSDGGRWWTGTSDSELVLRKQTITSGKLRSEGTAKKGVLPYDVLNDFYPSDLYLSVEGTPISGTASYGLIFSQTADGMYSFRVDNQSGTFGVSYYDEGKDESVSVIDWAKSPAINTNGTNRLAVLIKGTRLSVFINDQYVGAATDSHITKGQVGIAFGLAQGDSATVEFDDFDLYQP